MANEAAQGLRAVVTMLHQARHDLRLKTVGPLAVAVDQGGVFDYFDEVRKVIEWRRASCCSSIRTSMLSSFPGTSLTFHKGSQSVCSLVKGFRLSCRPSRCCGNRMA